MIHGGVSLGARRLALQYGDGDALSEFWKDSLHMYNSRNKVKHCQSPIKTELS